MENCRDCFFWDRNAHDVAALKLLLKKLVEKVNRFNGEERRYDKDGLGV